MNNVKDDLVMLSVILQNGLTENKGTILHAHIKKDTEFLNIECLVNGRYWGFYCYETYPPTEKNMNMSMNVCASAEQEQIDVPLEEMRALEDVLSNALTENKGTILLTQITKQFYVSIKYEFGGREFSLYSYLAKKKHLQ